MIDTYIDDSVAGLAICYVQYASDGIPGLRDTINGLPGGPPIDPPCNVYSYEIKAVTILDVDIDITEWDFEGVYHSLEDMSEDVLEKIQLYIQKEWGQQYDPT